MAFYSKERNIQVALPRQYDEATYDDYDTQIIVALSISLACLGVEIVGLFGGFSMFRPGLNLFYVMANFWGCVCISFFITEAWHYQSYWYIFAFCSALPA